MAVAVSAVGAADGFKHYCQMAKHGRVQLLVNIPPGHEIEAINVKPPYPMSEIQSELPMQIPIDIPLDRAERRAEARRLEAHHSRCHCCKLRWGFICEAPMMTNKAWSMIGNSRHEVLCWACSEARAQERLGRGLRFFDLLPAPVNFGHYGPDYVDFYWGRRTTIPHAWKDIIGIARILKQRAETGNPFDPWKNPEDHALVCEKPEVYYLANVIQKSRPSPRRWDARNVKPTSPVPFEVAPVQSA
jgi:hypothetical protein